MVSELRLDRLPQSFYRREPASVARSLIGKFLIRALRTDGVLLGGRIVETEAYLASDDAASHSARGKTASNAAMFGPAGLLYVYPIHAQHCLNAVTEEVGTGSAVLIRAIEPLVGIASMKEHRGQQDLRKLTRGPGMLCQALAVTRKLDGIDLTTDGRLTITSDVPDSILSQCEGRQVDPNVLATRRIGISKSAELRLRFAVQDSKFVSGPRSWA